MKLDELQNTGFMRTNKKQNETVSLFKLVYS